MKIYVLVANENGEATFNLPVFGRNIRVYASMARAKVYARRFNCAVVELNLLDGKIVYQS